LRTMPFQNTLLVSDTVASGASVAEVVDLALNTANLLRPVAE